MTDENLDKKNELNKRFNRLRNISLELVLLTRAFMALEPDLSEQREIFTEILRIFGVKLCWIKRKTDFFPHKFILKEEKQ